MDTTPTLHQPPIELSSSSDDAGSADHSGSSSMDDSEVDHQVFTTARRYNWYRQQYVPLFEQIINEANDMQAALFAGAYEDQTTGSYTEDLYQLVDKYVWAMMDRNLQETEQYNKK